jgi:hypothetical protein
LAVKLNDMPVGIVPDVTLAEVKLVPLFVKVYEVPARPLLVSVPLNEGVGDGAVTVIV